tara:strand:- start:639 stop:1064 length:426 start_codon:yes stop_codon:yes gene_type:complete
MENNSALGLKIPYGRDDKHGYFKQVDTTANKAKTNLMMLLMTSRGERPMMPDYGSELKEILFEQNIASSIDAELEDAVFRAVERWMPSVVIDNVKITRSDIEDEVNGASLGGPLSAKLEITFRVLNMPNNSQELTIQVGDY